MVVGYRSEVQSIIITVGCLVLCRQPGTSLIFFLSHGFSFRMMGIHVITAVFLELYGCTDGIKCIRHSVKVKRTSDSFSATLDLKVMLSFTESIQGGPAL